MRSECGISKYQDEMMDGKFGSNLRLNLSILNKIIAGR